MEVGPTGKFPYGKLDPSDQGELGVAMGIIPGKKLISLRFGTAVKWMALDLKTAKAFCKKLQDLIAEMESSP